MALDQDGVMLPRLRPADVARRGVAFGLLIVCGDVPLHVCDLGPEGHSLPDLWVATSLRR
ncbi:hypothetical protein AB0937_13470 [Streptomyces sp. NPDC047880]|uniref:hypothetical protein n=1 Tax=Streptomyces sp. NPDC047880 TaxID=3155626 RepID=UPI0034548807